MDISSRIKALIRGRKEAEKRLRQMTMHSDFCDSNFPVLHPLIPVTKQIIQQSINGIRQVKGYERYADYLQTLLDKGKIYGKSYTGAKTPIAESDKWSQKLYLNQNENIFTNPGYIEDKAVEFMPYLVHEATHLLDEKDYWPPQINKVKINADEDLAYATEIAFLLKLRQLRPDLKNIIAKKLEKLKEMSGNDFRSPLTIMKNNKAVHVRDYQRSHPPVHVHDYYRSFPNRRRILD